MNGEFIRKIKDTIIGQDEPITYNIARTIQSVGKPVDLETRINTFYREVDSKIARAAQSDDSILIVFIDKDIMDERKNIINTYKERGFKIYELTPTNDKLFIISWE